MEFNFTLTLNGKAWLSNVDPDDVAEKMKVLEEHREEESAEQWYLECGGVVQEIVDNLKRRPKRLQRLFRHMILELAQEEIAIRMQPLADDGEIGIVREMVHRGELSNEACEYLAGSDSNGAMSEAIELLFDVSHAQFRTIRVVVNDKAKDLPRRRQKDRPQEVCRTCGGKFNSTNGDTVCPECKKSES